MTKLLKYIHPARTTKFDIDKVYSLDELKLEMTLDDIKTFFMPINFKFENLEVKKKIMQKVVKEDIPE